MVSVDIASPRAAPVLVASVEGASVVAAMIQGHVSKGAGRWRVDLSGLGATPVRIDLVVTPGHGARARPQ